MLGSLNLASALLGSPLRAANVLGTTLKTQVNALQAQA